MFSSPRGAFVLSSRLFFGFLLIWAASSKIIRSYDFLATVYDYAILTPYVGLLAAHSLPWVEFVAGVFLVTGRLTQGACVISLCLFGIFLYAKATAVHRELSIGCGCIIESSGHVVGMSDVMIAALLFLWACLAAAVVLRRATAEAL
jgi:uncharacterized membrane protein YphA (DoxX/SURF4 family)